MKPRGAARQLGRWREAGWWIGAALGYVALCFLLAPNLLLGPLQGNDWPNALAYAQWIARSFPALPFWFPYQGGGVSPSAGYAITPIYAVAALVRAGVDLVVAGRVLAFAAMALGGLGVAALARSLGLGRGAALVAGALSLLPPAAWNLLIYVGFFANSVAAALIPWAVAALVAYARYQRAYLDRRGALLFGAAAALLALAFIAHPAISPVALVLGAIVAASQSARAAARVIIAGAAAALLAAGGLAAFVLYNRAANADGIGDLNAAILAQQQIPAHVLLGLNEIDPTSGLLEGMSITLFVLALGLVGGALFVTSRRGVALTLTTVFALAYLFSLQLEIVLATSVAVLSPLFGFRGFLIYAIVGLAVLAAAGLERLASFGPGRVSRTAVAIAAIGALVALEGPGYGPRHAEDPAFLRARLPAMLAQQTMLAGKLAKLPPGISATVTTEATQPLVSAQLAGLAGRGDVSPRLGGALKGLPLSSDARTMALYTFTLSLLHQSWADETQALFEPNAYGVAGADLNEMNAWFGIDAVSLPKADPSLGLDDATRFADAGWRVDTTHGGLVTARSPQARTLAAFRSRGVVLHVGQPKNQTYRNTYRVVSAGGLPFADGWLVSGPPCVDDVSADDLRVFDVVILEDQCERDPVASEAKLRAYVSGGGRLFVETGWEFSRFAIATPAPDWLPATELRWKSLGNAPALSFGSGTVDVSKLDLAKFGDFAYGDGTWDMSVPAGALREWARPVLLAGGTPIIAAGSYGSGRVVWSGMNLIAHLRAKQSAEERELYHRLFLWLLDGATAAPRELALANGAEDGATVTTPSAGWLLWREASYFATLTPESAARYSAGPGFLLARVAEGEVRVEQHPTGAMRAGTIVGAVAFAVLAAWTALAVALGGAADPGSVIGAIFGGTRRRVTTWVRSDEDDE